MVSPIEASDVAFTYKTFEEKGHPTLRQSLAGLQKVEATAKHEVQMHLRQGAARMLSWMR